jgi:hypothetical protein
MKKLITLLTFICFSFSLAFAEKYEETYDYDVTVEQDFAQLNKIEAYVNNNDVTLEELKLANGQLLKNIEINPIATFSMDELPLGVPPFWWGCVFSLLGVLLVFFISDNDSEAVKKAFLGCLVGGGASFLIYLLVAVIGLGAASV